MSADVVIRYWGGARAAAGVESETIHADSVGAALAQALVRRDGDPAFARVLSISSVLVDGVALTGPRLHDRLSHGVTAEILPPFAGGCAPPVSIYG
jgi:molybdopterin synthase sulfur carrier subunit